MKVIYQIQFMNTIFEPNTRRGTSLSGTFKAVFVSRSTLFPIDAVYASLVPLTGIGIMDAP
jgi:hypothetical protein